MKNFNEFRSNYLGSSKELDEISLDMLTKKISNTGLKNVRKDMKTDKLKKDLEKMRAKAATEAKEPASPDEQSMAMRQANFIRDFSEDLVEYIEKNEDFPEWMQNKLTAVHEKAKDLYSAMEGAEDDDDEMMEKTLTPAEKKKREEIAKAIERDKPNMPMAKKMAIATAQAKKVAEGNKK